MADEAKKAAGETEIYTQEEMRDRLIRNAFDGDPRRYEEFCEAVREGLPEGTGAILRGSAITGVRYDDGAPFDADGPGTSDLDLTLIGDEVMGFYILDGYYIPGLHTKPLSDKDPDIAPELVPLREKLQKMVGRPVNIQATTNLVMFVRENFMGQPYLTLIEQAKEE